MEIKNKIYNIRGKQVMLDRDLAELYEVQTRDLNKAVKRNIEKFPNDFMFKLDSDEFNNLMFQFGTSRWGGTRKPPLAFTEHGVSALSGVLKSQKATEINIMIIREFIAMRKLLSQNRMNEKKLQQIDQKLIEHDKNFEKIFNAIENKDIKPNKGIFFEGQIFDAHKFVSDLIKKAQNNIILIDNFVDYSVLSLFSNTNLDVTIYTKNITRKLKLDLEKYNSQYRPITIREFKSSHDRFLIIDNRDVYHFGASLKDLGKKWFAFSRFDAKAIDLLERLR